jgi:hypothetical protein
MNYGYTDFSGIGRKLERAAFTHMWTFSATWQHLLQPLANHIANIEYGNVQ